MIPLPSLRSIAWLLLITIAPATAEETPKESAVDRLLRENDEIRKEVEAYAADGGEWVASLRRDMNPELRKHITNDFDALTEELVTQADEFSKMAEQRVRPRETAIVILGAARIIERFEEALPEIVLEDAVERVRPRVTMIRERMDRAAERAARRFLETPPFEASLDADDPPSKRLVSTVRERTDWPQYRGAADRNNYRVGTTPPKRPEVLWSNATATNPAAVGDSVWVTGATLRKLSLRSGKTLGEWPLSAAATPVVTDDAVIVHTSNGVYAIRQDLESEVWVFRDVAPKTTLHAALSGTTYVVVLASGDLLALDVANGTERWRTRVTGDEGERTFLRGIECSPMIADGHVFIGTMSGWFRAFDLETGEGVWRYKGDHAFGWTDPVAAFGKVFIGDRAGVVHAFDIESGREVWKRLTGSTGLSEPGILPGAIVVGHANLLTILDQATGRSDSRRFATGLNPFGSPTLLGDAVLFGNLDGNFYAFDFRTEAPIFRLEALPEQQVSDFVFHRDVLLVSTTAGLYALADPSTSPESEAPSEPASKATGLHVVELR